MLQVRILQILFIYVVRSLWNRTNMRWASLIIKLIPAQPAFKKFASQCHKIDYFNFSGLSQLNIGRWRFKLFKENIEKISGRFLRTPCSIRSQVYRREPDGRSAYSSFVVIVATYFVVGKHVDWKRKRRKHDNHAARDLLCSLHWRDFWVSLIWSPLSECLFWLLYWRFGSKNWNQKPDKVDFKL